MIVDPFIGILFAAALGSIIGLERELHGQPAGLRTHMILAVGAAVAARAPGRPAGRRGREALDEARAGVRDGRQRRHEVREVRGNPGPACSESALQ